VVRKYGGRGEGTRNSFSGLRDKGKEGAAKVKGKTKKEMGKGMTWRREKHSA